MYIGFKGERFDGGKFYEDALKNGAKGAIINKIDGLEIKRLENKFVIQVDDTVEAVGQIAKLKREKYNIPVIAITGSVGKTTTREMIAHVLKGKYKVFETIGNQNSQVGVPLTLDHLTSEDEIGVLEMGMSEKGQITTLGNIIHPNVGVVTNVGVSHIEMMGSRDNICIEKLDIQNGLPEDVVLFLN